MKKIEQNESNKDNSKEVKDIKIEQNESNKDNSKEVKDIKIEQNESNKDNKEEKRINFLEYDNDVEVYHLIMSREETEAGNYYNNFTYELLK